MSNETQDLNVGSASRDEDPLVGRLLGGVYRVEVLIGVGGMGRVYRGTNEKMESRVAIKTLNVELRHDDALARRFEVEAKSAHNLRHPNTIRVYDYGVEDGQLYMVMELLEGESLEDRLRREGALPPLDAIRIIREACQSLTEAHEQGMVHRDLKPDNLFLNRIGGQSEHIKVLDFGVAKLNDNRFTNATLTQMGMIFGTPRYMSPEQARAQQLDGRSDIYALGVILYELLCGKPPFDGAEPVSVLIKHVNEEPPTFDEIAPGHQIPDALEHIVRRCLLKEPEQRYASVQELDEVLARAENALRQGGAAGGHETRQLREAPTASGIAGTGALTSSEREGEGSRWFGGFGRTLASRRGAGGAGAAAAPGPGIERILLWGVVVAIVLVGALLFRVLQSEGDEADASQAERVAAVTDPADVVRPESNLVAIELLPAGDMEGLRAHPEGDEERSVTLPHVFRLDRSETPKAFIVLADGHAPARHEVPRTESTSVTLAPGPARTEADTPAADSPPTDSAAPGGSAAPRERARPAETATPAREGSSRSPRTERTREPAPTEPRERTPAPRQEEQRDGLRIDIVDPY